jgi:hypothetical protein
MDAPNVNHRVAHFVRFPNSHGFMFIKKPKGGVSLEEPVRCKFISGVEAINLINQYWGNYARTRLELLDRSVNPLFKSLKCFYAFVDIKGIPHGSAYIFPTQTGLFVYEMIKAPWSLSRSERRKFAITETAYNYKVTGLGAASLALACVKYTSARGNPDNQTAICISTIKIPMEWAAVLRPRKLVPDNLFDFFNYSDFKRHSGRGHSNNIFYTERTGIIYKNDFVPDTREVTYFLTFPGTFSEVFLSEYCEFLEEFETNYF